MLHRGHYHAVRGPVAAQFVGDDHPWHVPQSRQQLTKEPGGGLGIAPGLDEDVQDDTVLVNGPCTDPKPRCRSVTCCFVEWIRLLGGIR